jgi:predicted amidohydrolase
MASARQPLTIAVAQPRIEAHDVGNNVARHAHVVRQAHSRVVIFPELSLTGYELDAAPLALDDARLAALVDACAATGSIAFAGAPIAEHGGLFIAMLAVDRDGVRVAYRKMYLGDAEAQRFSPGREPVAVEVDGWRLGLAVCKDTRIAEHAAATADLRIDAYVAGILESAGAIDIPEERAARVAREHDVWVAIASYAGSAGGGFAHAIGRSGVWRPDGSVCVRAGDAVDEVVCATFTGDD